MEEAILAEGFHSLRGGEFHDAGTAATELRSALCKLGISQESIRRAAVSAFEAEMNVIIHAIAGTLRYAASSAEVKITVNDIGPGIENVELAMQKGFSTAPKWAKEKGWGSGLGLPNIKENSDKLLIDTVPGEGTTVEIIVRFGNGASGTGVCADEG